MKALMVIPMPCEGRLFFKVATAVAKRWEADHPGKTMAMDHFETRASEFGQVTVIWDEVPPAPPAPEKPAWDKAEPYAIYSRWVKTGQTSKSVWTAIQEAYAAGQGRTDSALGGGPDA